MDGEAWWARVHGVTKSQTGLSNFTSDCEDQDFRPCQEFHIHVCLQCEQARRLEETKLTRKTGSQRHQRTEKCLHTKNPDLKSG